LGSTTNPLAIPTCSDDMVSEVFWLARAWLSDKQKILSSGFSVWVVPYQKSNSAICSACYSLSFERIKVSQSHMFMQK